VIVLGAVAALIVILVIAGIGGVARTRVRKHGFLVLAWRWLSGEAHHGKPVTNAGWTRKGTKALTPTGHAHRWWFHRRRRRMAHRSGASLGVLAALLGLLLYPAETLTAVAAAVAIAAVGLGFLTWRLLRSRKHHREWVEPLHAAVAPIVGVPVERNPRSWIEITRDRGRVTVTLPEGWTGKQSDRDQLVCAVTAKAGLENPDIRWQLTGPSHQVGFDAAAAPPASVALADVRPAIEAAKPGQLVLGKGKRDTTVNVSQATDSPHLGASMGTGGGKSTLGRLLLAQHCHHGGVGLVLDAKLFSHPWCWGLPNVAYAAEPAEFHEALFWLGDELHRRNRVARASTDVEGRMHANPGASLMVLAEEFNLTLPILRSYWQEARERGDPDRSPAIGALEAVAFAGRAVRMHLVMIGQMLTSRATGSGEARENGGIRILARYSFNGWRLLVPEHAMPPASGIDGRVQVVASVRQMGSPK
jgi:hypothetical protein